jgi:hypothetical protein
LKSIEGLDPLYVSLEKFYRNEWIPEILNARRPDFCRSFKNPSEAWYLKTRRLKGYPKARVRVDQDFRDDPRISFKSPFSRFKDEFVFDMEPVFDFS